MFADASSGSHCVHFYEPTLFPAKHVAEFIRNGIAENEGIVIVACKEHAIAIEKEVEALGIGVPREMRSQGLWSFVNTDILLRALLSGVPIDRLVGNAIDPTVQESREKSPAGRIRIYGEFADLVLREGKLDSCLELERYGVQIASENAADIYCGYSAGSFPDAGSARHFTKVCLLHNLIHTNLQDRSDWRYRMALGIAQDRRDFGDGIAD